MKALLLWAAPAVAALLLWAAPAAAALLLVASCSLAEASEGEGASAFAGTAGELILCGWDEVFILDLSASESNPPRVWSWRAKDRPELPEHMKDRFRTTDECKPVGNGDRILITSSAGGVALVERASGRAVFWATAPNAHSAELLPGERVAVAASHKENGDRLILFDVHTPEREVWSDELSWGHGVVWDAGRQIVWALSNHDLRAYRLKDWESDSPSLARLFAVDLPETGGHDLYPVPGTPQLSVTTASHCWLFDRDARSFRLHPSLSEKPGVKSICVNPSTRQTAYVQAEGENWWAERVHFLGPEGLLHLPGEHLYKARWNAR